MNVTDEGGGWEYFMKEFDPSDSATVELWHNHQGIPGWELVTVVSSPSGQHCIAFMKRSRLIKEEGVIL
jgi:hypothetical protein